MASTTCLSREIGSQVTAVTTASAAWFAIEALHVSQSRARVISTRMALATASKGTSSINEYSTKMKALADEMASTGKKLEDEELVSYILTVLDLASTRWCMSPPPGSNPSQLVSCTLNLSTLSGGYGWDVKMSFCQIY